MTQRHFFYASQMPEMARAQTWNHPQPDPSLHSENGSFVHSSVDIATNTALRPNDYSSSSLGSGFSNYMVANPGPSSGLHSHPSTSVGASYFQPDQAQQVPPPCFNQLPIREGSSMVNPQANIGRAGSKRKSPAVPLAVDRGNSSGYYSAGNSFNVQASSDCFYPKSIMGPQYRPVDPASLASSSGINDLVIAGEASQRNVRSRHCHAPQMDINSSRAYPLAIPSPHFHVTAGTYSPNMTGQWGQWGQWFNGPVSVAPQARALPSGSNAMNASMMINGAPHSTHTQIRSQTAALATLPGVLIQGTGSASSSHNHRLAHFRANASYQPIGFAATSLENGGPPGVEAVPPARYSRPLSIIGRSSNRNGRSRNSYGRVQSVYEEDSGRSRWLSEAAVMMDRSTFYDSRGWFDQHRDMRLDIDDLSYEELLALEERIGNVSTGLSEDAVSGCLTETIYCSSEQCQDNEEGGSCVICLEEYKDGDNLGRLKCGHDFHVDCIKNWLQIKNVCPICKADAFKDTVKEKEK